LPDTAGASRRATCALAHAHLRRFLRCTPGRAFRLGHWRSSRPKAGSANIQVVSQLLAGPRSGPGRSPGAARVLDCVSNPRAPRLVPPRQRLAKAPFVGRGGWSVSEVWEAGIRRDQPGGERSSPGIVTDSIPPLWTPFGGSGWGECITPPGDPAQEPGRHPPHQGEGWEHVDGRDKPGHDE
jgi:hypothetical protein